MEYVPQGVWTSAKRTPMDISDQYVWPSGDAVFGLPRARILDGYQHLAIFAKFNFNDKPESDHLGFFCEAAAACMYTDKFCQILTYYFADSLSNNIHNLAKSLFWVMLSYTGLISSSFHAWLSNILPSPPMSNRYIKSSTD